MTNILNFPDWPMRRVAFARHAAKMNPPSQRRVELEAAMDNIQWAKPLGFDLEFLARWEREISDDLAELDRIEYEEEELAQ